MSKELKALEHIDKTISSIRCYGKVDISDDVDASIEIVRQALQELKAIKEAKPSDALESLKSLDIQTRFMGILDIPSWEKHLPIVKQALLKAEKLEKTWKVVKEKNVDMFELKCCSSAKSYNECISFKIGFVKNYELTQQEFELLKEMLCDE